MKNNIIQNIKSDISRLDKKYNINEGGCCFTASIIAKQLEKRNVPFKIIIIDTDVRIESIKELQTRFIFHEQLFTRHSACAHVSIAVKNENGRYVDLNEMTDVQNDIKCGFFGKAMIKGSSDDLKYMYENNGWYFGYNTKYNVSVRKSIEKSFRKNIE